MALAVMALGLFSCADEPDKYEVASGLPSVSYVRCLRFKALTTIPTCTTPMVSW